MQEQVINGGSLNPGLPKVFDLIKFYLPLFVQAVSQSFTYPLVAIVAANGMGGALNAAGLAQTNNVMWLISCIGGGILTGGMVYGKSKQGFQKFVQANFIIMTINLVVLALVSVPFFSHIVFHNIIGLTGQIERAANISFPVSIPLNALFYIRNPFHALLLINKKTGLSYFGTIGRIGLTLILSPVFIALGLVGPTWAMVCLAIPLVAEVIGIGLLAKPYLRKLSTEPGKQISLNEILLFILPISVGQILLNFSSFVVGSCAARAALAEAMLPAYYLAMGLTNPIIVGLLHIRMLMLSFGQSKPAERFVLRFTLAAGLVLGLIPIMFNLPFIDQFYYVNLQKLPPRNLFLVHQSALALLALPILMSLRAFYEGKAALRKKPFLILFGHAVYMGIVTTSAFLSLSLGMQGNLIGPLAINLGNVFAVSMLMLGLYWDERSPGTVIAEINPPR